MNASAYSVSAIHRMAFNESLQSIALKRTFKENQLLAKVLEENKLFTQKAVRKAIQIVLRN